MSTPSTSNVGYSKSTLSLVALIAAGLAGNYFKFPIFLNIDFLFGSIFAMLVLQLFGLGRGLAAAAIIASYTYILWNHPYAIIIMTAEVAVVGWLSQRRKMGMVLADAIFWLCIGMPLVYLFYYIIMHASLSSVAITMTKQAMNGIANTMAARLIFMAIIARSNSKQISLREIIATLLIFFIMLQSLMMLAVASRKDFAETDQRIRSSLTYANKRLEHYVSAWVVNRKIAISNLADMAATKSPQQMQQHLEQAKKSDVNFLRVGLLNSEATTTAYFPLFDELGQHNIGKNFADRPFIAKMKQTLKPMLSEVVMGKVGTRRPIVSMLAPVIIHGKYAGYTIGVLSLQQLQDQLDKSLIENATLYTLLDKNGNIILTNRADQKQMMPIKRGKGSLNHLDSSFSQWIPTLPPNTPTSERWKKSLYVSETPIGDLAEWKLVLEQPVAPFQKMLYDDYTGKLTLLFLFLLGVMGAAELISRRSIIALDTLRLISHELPDKLVTDETSLVWPESNILEIHHLIDNFRAMAGSLSGQFAETKRINESLEQRVAERTEELQKSELFTNDILDSLPSNIAVLDANGIIIAVNEPWRNFAKENRGPGVVPSHIGDSYLEVSRVSYEGEDDEGAEDAIRGIRSVLQGKEEKFTLEYPCHSSTVKRWFTMNVLKLQGSHSGVVVSHTNITDRKRMEIALHESEATFRSLASSAPVGIYQTDSQGNCVYVNNKWCEISGLTFEEAMGPGWAHALHPEDRDKVFAEWNAAVSVQRLFLSNYRFKLPSGAERWVSGIASPLYSDSHELSGYIGSISDISESKQYEELLLKAKSVAESANTAKSNFLANMSHEIRTPMNGVLGMTQLLEMTELTAEQFSYTTALKTSGKSLLSLINDILDLSKIEAGKMNIELSEFSFQRCINDIIQTQQSITYTKGLTLDAELSEDIPAILVGDQQRIKQVLLNLMGNAIKFTQQGMIAISAKVIEKHESSVLVEIAVSDSGIGISSDVFNKIFEPFEQVDGSITRNFGGTGLGLAISRRLVELMGGSITVESTPGVGSRFVVTLPFTYISAPAIAAVTKATTAHVWTGPPMRILLVDDTPINITLGVSLCSKLGFDVTAVDNGLECMESMKQGHYDLVLMDIKMPIMSGDEVIRKIRMNEQNTDIHQPVIALTAYALHGDKDRFLEEGFDGYVSKPLETIELLCEINRVMGIVAVNEESIHE
jgi:PAS domain S-box-containing protein